MLSGIGSPLDPEKTDTKQIVDEWQRTRAIPFDIEAAITREVYIELRATVKNFIAELEQETLGFLEFEAEYIASNLHFLPVLQRLADISSKAALKRKIGTVSDNAISKPAAERLAQLLNQRKPGRAMTHAQLTQSVEPTLEGIVRDLVGRVLLESIVANALDDAKIPYKRENE